MAKLGIDTSKGVHVGIHCFRHGVTELLEAGTPIHIVTGSRATAIQKSRWVTPRTSSAMRNVLLQSAFPGRSVLNWSQSSK
jgi:hypothetical protein